MTRIETHADSRRSIEPLDNRRQMVESIADGSPLSRGMFEQHHRLAATLARKNAADSICDENERIRFGSRRARARMQDDAEQTERMCPVELIGEGVERLSPQGRIGRCEI